MNVVRRASEADLPAIHEIQNVEFRTKVFVEPLPPVHEFVEGTWQNIQGGIEQYFVLEIDGEFSGFVRLLKKDAWEALSWGKWLNTLVYACFVVAFDRLELDRVRFAIREDNVRVIHLYKKFQFHKIEQELMVYRWGLLDPIRTVTINHYEITREEFEQKRDTIRKTSLELDVRV